MSMAVDQKAALEISVSVYSAFGKGNRASIPDSVVGHAALQWLHSSPFPFQSTLFRATLGQVHP